MDDFKAMGYNDYALHQINKAKMKKELKKLWFIIVFIFASGAVLYNAWLVFNLIEIYQIPFLLKFLYIHLVGLDFVVDFYSIGLKKMKSDEEPKELFKTLFRKEFALSFIYLVALLIHYIL